MSQTAPIAPVVAEEFAEAFAEEFAKPRAPAPAMPPQAPLAMPVQDLRTAPKPARRGGGGPLAARLFVFGGALLLTAYGAWQMYEVISVSGGATWLQYLLLVLFVLNFSWIALAFTGALVGFAALLRSGAAGPMPTRLTTRTAVVMPVYNEGSARVFAGLQAMHESVAATGLGAHYDWFVLSDSTQADAWVAEERAFRQLREELGPDARLYYRHREKNHHRKAGNIAGFVTGWGGAYDHMLVLDADSLLTGECIVRLTAAMEADPNAGIVQSLPLIVNRNTLFARLQQFAARIYGPVIATGLSVWSGRDGNYWGHNAIIRMAAFAEAAGLPDLKGRPPFGGHILSHDFVEAALIRRAGWGVTMLPRLEGSYEESPPSLIDLAVRDRRWAQGNLQHARVIGAAGLAPASRQHFATGIAGYVASPLWLAQLVIGLIIVLQTAWVRPEYFSAEFGLYPVWPRFDPVRALQLFALTMGILLAPKFLGLFLALLDARVRQASGGAGRLTLSFLIEILLSALIAPIAMVVQSGSVFQILAGRDTGWNPQRRDDGSIPLSDIVRRHRWHTLLGVVTGIGAFAIATSLFLWMSPTILGLVLAIPLSWASGQLAFGLALKRRGLLVTPEEETPPPIARRAGELAARNAARG
ncbi:MAG: glucans biosynthesis glucosyltransferase MdoH, partial [Methylorubrum rhodinum]|uniref:glucans biosynthesis glucosyltransferase MdoH n=1 Tax=Methylorubrum rhodinum TaxID=29428 RepID=UPI003BAFA294